MIMLQLCKLVLSITPQTTPFFLEIFPFKEIDSDIQQYGQHFYVQLNFLIPYIKTNLDYFLPAIQQKIEEIKNKAEKQMENNDLPINLMKFITSVLF